DKTSPEHAALAAGLPFYGEVMMQGTRFHGAFQPFTDLKNVPLGAFFVGGDAQQAEAAADGSVPGMAIMGLVLLVMMGGICLLLSRRLTGPIPRIAGAMQAIADGNYTTEVPYVARGNELGAMAR